MLYIGSPSAKQMIKYFSEGFVKYSFDEQVVGEWVDGKPVYQKTVFIENAANGTLVLSNVDQCIHVHGNITYSNGNIHSFPFQNDPYIDLYKLNAESTDLFIYNTTGTAWTNLHATILYTKSID